MRWKHLLGKKSKPTLIWHTAEREVSQTTVSLLSTDVVVALFEEVQRPVDWQVGPRSAQVLEIATDEEVWG